MSERPGFQELAARYAHLRAAVEAGELAIKEANAELDGELIDLVEALAGAKQALEEATRDGRPAEARAAGGRVAEMSRALHEMRYAHEGVLRPLVVDHAANQAELAAVRRALTIELLAIKRRHGATSWAGVQLTRKPAGVEILDADAAMEALAGAVVGERPVVKVARTFDKVALRMYLASTRAQGPVPGVRLVDASQDCVDDWTVQPVREEPAAAVDTAA